MNYSSAKTYMLATLRFPAALASYLIDRLANTERDALSHNYELGPDMARLITKNVSADAAGSLAAAPYPEVLDAILSSRESRVGVLESLHHAWRLSDADQLRFVNRALKDVTADMVLRSPAYTFAAQSIAARRASASAVSSWLNGVDVPDDLLTPVALDITSRSRVDLGPLTQLLYVRPALRDGFAASTDALGLSALAWMPLNKLYEHHLYENTREDNSHQRFIATGLLFQPALDRAIRRELWDQLIPSHATTTDLVYEHGLADPDDPIWVGCHLSEVTDRSVQLALLSYLSAVRFDRPYMRILRTSLLAELAQGVNDFAVAERLVAQMLQNRVMLTYPSPLPHHLHQAVTEMADRVCSSPAQLETLLGRSWSNLNYQLTGTPQPESATSSSLRHPAGPSAPVVPLAPGDSEIKLVGEWVFQPGSPYRRNPVPAALDAYLHYRLGDAASENSKQRWIMFLDFLEEHPDSSMKHLCDLVTRITPEPAE